MAWRFIAHKGLLEVRSGAFLKSVAQNGRQDLKQKGFKVGRLYETKTSRTNK